MSLQLGFVSAIVPDLSDAEVFDLAASLGYECVELMCWPKGKADRRYAGVTHVDVQNLDAAAIDRLHNLSASSKVAISGLGYYPNILTADQEESSKTAAHLELVIAAAKSLGLRVVSTFVGRNQFQSVEENWPRFLQVWKRILRVAEDNGILIAIENCPMLFTADEWPGGKNLASSPAIWERMFNDLPSPNFGLNYDPSHLLWQQMDYIAPLTQFHSRIFRVHAKDAAVHHDKLNRVGIRAHPLEFHSPRLPGLGDIDWGRFVTGLEKSGYSGPVCVEVEDKRYEDTLEGRKKALELSAAHLRQFISPARNG